MLHGISLFRMVNTVYSEGLIKGEKMNTEETKSRMVVEVNVLSAAKIVMITAAYAYFRGIQKGLNLSAGFPAGN